MVPLSATPRLPALLRLSPAKPRALGVQSAVERPSIARKRAFLEAEARSQGLDGDLSAIYVLTPIKVLPLIGVTAANPVRELGEEPPLKAEHREEPLDV